MKTEWNLAIISKLEHLLCSLSLLLLLSACGSHTPTPTPTASPKPDLLLVNYFSEPGRFEVWLPTTQSIHEDGFTQTEIGEPAECHRLWSEANGASWMIRYCDYSPAVINKFTRQELLNRARDEDLETEIATLISEQDITLRGIYSGRLVIAQAAMRGLGNYHGTYKMRIYIADHRLYWVSAKVYEENWDNRMITIDPFLESFYIESN